MTVARRSEAHSGQRQANNSCSVYTCSQHAAHLAKWPGHGRHQVRVSCMSTAVAVYIWKMCYQRNAKQHSAVKSTLYLHHSPRQGVDHENAIWTEDTWPASTQSCFWCDASNSTLVSSNKIHCHHNWSFLDSGSLLAWINTATM